MSPWWEESQVVLLCQFQFILSSPSPLRHKVEFRRPPPLARSTPGPVADRNYLPSHSRRFCSAYLFHSLHKQDPLSNSLLLVCPLGCTSPLMRHCAVWCFCDEMLFGCSVDKTDLLGALLLFEMGRAIFLNNFLVPFGGTTSWNTQT